MDMTTDGGLAFKSVTLSVVVGGEGEGEIAGSRWLSSPAFKYSNLRGHAFSGRRPDCVATAFPRYRCGRFTSGHRDDLTVLFRPTIMLICPNRHTTKRFDAQGL